MKEELVICDVCGCHIPKTKKPLIDFSRPVKDQINPIALYSLGLRIDDIESLLGDICGKCLHKIDADIFAFKTELLEESKK